MLCEMTLTEILQANCVKVPAESKTKEAVIADLVGRQPSLTSVVNLATRRVWFHVRFWSQILGFARLRCVLFLDFAGLLPENKPKLIRIHKVGVLWQHSDGDTVLPRRLAGH